MTRTQAISALIGAGISTYRAAAMIHQAAERNGTSDAVPGRNSCRRVVLQGRDLMITDGCRVGCPHDPGEGHVNDIAANE